MKTHFFSSILIVMVLGLVNTLTFKTSVANTTVDTYFQDGNKYGKDPERCKKSLYLYKQFYKQWKNSGYKSNVVDEALKNWRTAFTICPTSSFNMYLHGVKMYAYKLEQAEEANKVAYMDSVEMVYLQRLQYFPVKKGVDQKGEIYSDLGTDIFKYTPEQNEKAFDYLKQGLNIQKDNASISTMVYYFRSAIKRVKQGKAEESSIIDVYDELMSLIEPNLLKNANDEKVLAQWQNAKNNVEKTFEPYATCEVLTNIYGKKFEANPNDVELLTKITKILKKKRCTSDPLFFSATEKLYKLQPNANAAMLMGKMLLAKEQYGEAAKYMEEAVDMLETDMDKADVLSDLGRIYFKLKQHTKARNFAYKALKLNPNDGMTYILIGDMYVATASECGTDEIGKKAAFWAAVDKYAKAKKVDAEAAELAQKRINSYSRYFPTLEKLFFHDLKDGDPYKVGGWINENTTVRAAK